MAWGWFDHKRSDSSSEWTGFLEQGVKIEGRLESSGTFRIDSALKGTVVSRETLILGEHAAVEGEIDGNNIIIAGRFDGTIHAAKKVEIQPKAIVTGHIHAPCIIIEPGAVFEGQCHMPSSAEDAQPTVIPVRSAVTQT
jgi:cytoskeletal protein CcmA (bactofilin family)